MRQRNERERLRGGRTNYLGSEVFLSLVDGDNAPYGSDLSQLAVRAVVTNRDLPLLLPTGAPDVFHLPEGGPVRHGNDAGLRRRARARRSPRATRPGG